MNDEVNNAQKERDIEQMEGVLKGYLEGLSYIAYVAIAGMAMAGIYYLPPSNKVTIGELLLVTLGPMTIAGGIAVSNKYARQFLNNPWVRGFAQKRVDKRRAKELAAEEKEKKVKKTLQEERGEVVSAESRYGCVWDEEIEIGKFFNGLWKEFGDNYGLYGKYAARFAGTSVMLAERPWESTVRLSREDQREVAEYWESRIGKLANDIYEYLEKDGERRAEEAVREYFWAIDGKTLELEGKDSVLPVQRSEKRIPLDPKAAAEFDKLLEAQQKGSTAIGQGDVRDQATQVIKLKGKMEKV